MSLTGISAKIFINMYKRLHCKIFTNINSFPAWPSSQFLSLRSFEIADAKLSLRFEVAVRHITQCSSRWSSRFGKFSFKCVISGEHSKGKLGKTIRYVENNYEGLIRLFWHEFDYFGLIRPFCILKIIWRLFCHFQWHCLFFNIDLLLFQKRINVWKKLMIQCSQLQSSLVFTILLVSFKSNIKPRHSLKLRRFIQ